jgi:CheY-like chemotaxis protein
MAALNPEREINFSQVKLLLLDDHAAGAKILIQIVRGFGASKFVHCTSITEAQKCVEQNELHLVLINANLKDAGIYDFINWLRRYHQPPNCYASIVLIAGHTPRSTVERARDSGANIILAKPVSPMSVLERLVWTARDKRDYVKSDTYVGPDRRFHDLGPLLGLAGRRLEDRMPGPDGGDLVDPAMPRIN